MKKKKTISHGPFLSTTFHICSFQSISPLHVHATLLNCRLFHLPEVQQHRRDFSRHLRLSVRCCHTQTDSDSSSQATTRRRDVLVTPLLVLGASVLRSAVARADEKLSESAALQSSVMTAIEAPSTVSKAEEKEEVINSRIYNATVIGEPLAVGKDKRKVWEKLMSGRIVYLGEAKQVPTRDDKELELQILNILQKRCGEEERPISLPLEAFSSNLQEQLNQYMSGRSLH